ncbi:MAG: rod shape-determining protein MreC [Alphaproteobacteria bacterium]|nr:rod shape-determining protein MreC [Alphaproteobacteria bacterium]
MNPKKTSSRLRTIVKSAFIALLFPTMLIYIVVAKPDYKFMNGLTHVILPVFRGIGDVVTWPVRAGGDVVRYFHNISNLESENEELRARLAQALANQNECNIAILENQRLIHQLDIVHNINFQSVIADIISNNSAINHGNFLINRGSNDGIEKGMAVVSLDNTLVGMVIDAGADYARVRSLNDSNTNIPVRIAGADVFGFVRGNGSSKPTIGFFSDSKFQGSRGVKIVTSNIGGVLPADIYVGKMLNETELDVTTTGKLSRVIVLKFNTQGKYK